MCVVTGSRGWRGDSIVGCLPPSLAVLSELAYTPDRAPPHRHFPTQNCELFSRPSPSLLLITALLPLFVLLCQNCELFTCSMETVKRRIPACTHTSTMLLPPMVGVLEDPAGEPAGASDADNSLGQEGSADDAMGEERGGGRGGRGSGGAGATSDDFSGGALVWAVVECGRDGHATYT